MASLRGFQSVLHLALLGIAAAFAAVAPGCSHAPLETHLGQPGLYFDNTLPFQPNRVWRLWVKWEPYLLSEDKAIVVKELQYVVRGERDRKALEADIEARGGDVRYLRWLETEFFPLGNWERREEARIARYKDLMVAVIITRALKEVPRSGRLTLGPVWFPDPIFRAARDGCHELNWDVIPVGDSIGTEVILETRYDEAGADQWKRVERDSSTHSWRQWSVGEGRRIAYRTAILLKNNISTCPLPPRIHADVQQLVRGQPMGIAW